MMYTDHQIQILLMMMLNLMIMPYISRYALILFRRNLDYLEEMDIIKQAKR